MSTRRRRRRTRRKMILIIYHDGKGRQKQLYKTTEDLEGKTFWVEDDDGTRTEIELKDL